MSRKKKQLEKANNERIKAKRADILDVWLARKVQSQSSYDPQYYRHVGLKSLLHTTAVGAHKYLIYSLNPCKLHILSQFLIVMLQNVNLLH